MKSSRNSIVAYCSIFIALYGALSSCSPSREQMANETLEKAVELYTKRQYNSAKILLDSIIFTYPDLKQIVRSSKDMMNVVYLTEQERNLQFLDSLLNIREAEVEPLLKYFQEEDPQASNPILISKKQSVGSSFDRALVKAHTDRNGQFFISTHYTGTSPIHHYAVKAEVDELYAISDTITDDALNHSFSDGNEYWESIRFKNATDNGVGEFIASNADRKIRISFITPKGTGYKFLLTETDKQAISETYYLATLLRETIHIKGQIRNVRTALKHHRSASNNSAIIKK